MEQLVLGVRRTRYLGVLRLSGWLVVGGEVMQSSAGWIRIYGIARDAYSVKWLVDACQDIDL